jgi:RimJ/RimL family protein N-acetyltransferase
MKSDKTIKNHRIDIKSPNDCNDSEKEAFYCLVEKGGEARTDNLTGGIDRARFLAFYYINETLIAIAALKQNLDYQKNVFERAGIQNLTDNFNLEIGYAFTEEEYRCQGICSTLIHELINKISSEKIFATVRVKNKNMIKILINAGFQSAGNPFRGSLMCRGKYYIQLFLRD